jgi:hypothetical protein
MVTWTHCKVLKIPRAKRYERGLFMFKISHVSEICTIKDVPQEVIDVAEGVVAILDREYGVDRDPLLHDGGYCVLLSPSDDISVFKELDLDIEDLCPEHTDIIKTADGIIYIHAVILCNNEFSIHILMPRDKASPNLLE